MSKKDKSYPCPRCGGETYKVSEPTKMEDGTVLVVYWCTWCNFPVHVLPNEPKKEVLVEEMNGVILILPQPDSYAKLMLGLGKEVWKEINPKTYVAKERARWK